MSDRDELIALRRLAELEAKAAGSQPTPQPIKHKDPLRDVIGGGIRGAGSIGATLMAPQDMLEDFLEKRIRGGSDKKSRNEQRREDMTAALDSLGVDTGSGHFAAGKLGTEIMGTAGMGPLLAGGAKAVPALAKMPAFVDALGTAGMSAAGKTGLAGAGARAAGGAVTGGAAAGLVDPEQAKAGAVIGGVLPGALKVAGEAGKATGAAARKVFGQVSDEVAALANRAKELGIHVPADRLVNSRPLNAAAASLNYMPMSGRAATERKMVEQLDRALSRTFGQDSANVTMALRKANTELGSQFDDFLRNNQVSISPKFKAALSALEDQATSELGQDGASVIHKQIAAIQAKGAAGAIDGQAAYNIKKALDRIGGRNSSEAYYARELKRALMEALNDSVGPEKAQAFAALRKQYGNMLDIEKIASNGAEGGVSVGRLANMKHIGNDDLQELADISAQFLKTRENPHGALQRLVIGGTAAPVAAGAGALPIFAGAMAAGRGANMLLNSGMARNALMGGQQAPSVLANELQQYLLRSAPVAGASR